METRNFSTKELQEKYKQYVTLFSDPNFGLRHKEIESTCGVLIMLMTNNKVPLAYLNWSLDQYILHPGTKITHAVHIFNKAMERFKADHSLSDSTSSRCNYCEGTGIISFFKITDNTKWSWRCLCATGNNLSNKIPQLKNFPDKESVFFGENNEYLLINSRSYHEYMNDKDAFLQKQQNIQALSAF